MIEKNPLKIAMIAAEAAPYAKVGGLGDVVGALPKALDKLGASVTVIIPGYAGANACPSEPCRAVSGFDVPMGNFTERASIFQTVMKGTSVEVYLICSSRYFDREGIYDDPFTKEGYADNMERYVFFMKAAVELLRHMNVPFDILHCHDSQTALIPALIRENYEASPFFIRLKTVFTIHNLAYQGIYPREALELAGIAPRRFYSGSPFEYWGQVNFMKAGILLADQVTTVSPTYAEEIQADAEFGMGLEGVLCERKQDLRGIINGIDYEEWDPSTDPFIAARFSSENISGKAVCKDDVLRCFNLPRPTKRTPLIGVVSRLADQKGFDLVAQAMPEIASMNMQMVVLGNGQQKYHDMFSDIAARYPDKVGVRLGYDNPLAHRIEAGCDMFLMPSKYEPCGLNQLYSLRYGAIPIVHRTGGLVDTVEPYAGNEGTGFSFSEYSAEALLKSIREALALYATPFRWKKLTLRAMSKDWSWHNSAHRYLELYQSLLPHS